MLRLSKMADYGSQVMAYMARDNAVHSANEVACATGIAVPTVSKILKMLARGNLLSSVRGAKGGYVISRPPEAISIAQIIDAMDGPISITECSTSTCLQESVCSTRSNWQGINTLIRDALEKVTLAQMMEPKPQVVNLATGGIYV
ncbi:MAG: SUF system Fe-S cluster assembly regulator [Burkholderiales bacterium]|nr:SUF system Fe-S cluster assembly regulator [Burkholderiales bacterium]